MQTESQL